MNVRKNLKIFSVPAILITGFVLAENAASPPGLIKCIDNCNNSSGQSGSGGGGNGSGDSVTKGPISENSDGSVNLPITVTGGGLNGEFIASFYGHRLPGYMNNDTGGGGAGGGNIKPLPEKTDGTQKNQSPCPRSNKPVIIATGNKVKTEDDFHIDGQVPLGMERYYNGNSSAVGIFGSHWSTVYDTKVNPIKTYTISRIGCKNGQCPMPQGTVPSNYGNSNKTNTADFRMAIPRSITTAGSNNPVSCTVPDSGYSCSYVINIVDWINPDGSSVRYTYNSSTDTWLDGKPTPQSHISHLSDGTWLRTGQFGESETYSSQGLMKKLTNNYNQSLTLAYSNNGPNGAAVLSSVQEPGGKQLSLTQQPNGYVASITLPNGKVFRYDYGSTDGTNSYDHLSKVSFPDGLGTRAYQYTTGTSTGHLTAILINGVKYSNYTYYPDPSSTNTDISAGRVKTSSVGNDTDNFSYSNAPQTTLTNVNGVATSYSYQYYKGEMKLTGVSRAAASATCPAGAASYSYDNNGYPTQSIDWNGNQTNYVYDSAGRQTSVLSGITAANVNGDWLVNTTWDTTHNRVTDIKTYGGPAASTFIREEIYSYYPDGDPAANRLQSYQRINRSSNGVANQTQTTSFSYTFWPNKLLNTVQKDGPIPGNSDITTYSFDQTGVLISLKNALGQTTTIGNYNGMNQPGSTTDPNGRVTKKIYDAIGRLVTLTETIGGVDQSVTTSYGLDFSVINNYPTGLTEKLQYDVVGNLLSTQRGVELDQLIYSNLNQVTQETIYQLPTANSAPNPSNIAKQSFYDYDELGRKISQRGSNQQKVVFKYDNNNNVLSITDSLNATTNFDYDAHNRLVKTTDALNNIIQYMYSSDTLSAVVDPRNNITTYAYDGLGQLITQSSPDTGTTTSSYDDAGRRTGLIRSDNTNITYSFDVLNRTKSISSGNSTQTFSYDSCANGVGHLCSTSDTSSNTTTGYTYNLQGQIITNAQTIAGTQYTSTLSYDNIGRLSSYTYPGGNKANYGYDGYNRINSVQITTPNGTTNLLNASYYLPYGPLASTSLGNGLQRAESYDLDYREVKKEVAQNTNTEAGVIQKLSMSYDVRNDLKVLSNGVNSNLNQNFSYDQIQRLTNVAANDSTFSRSWSLDANGNRQSETDGSNAQTAYGTAGNNNQLNALTGAINNNITYDVLGNMLTHSQSGNGPSGNHTYNYDDFKRLNSLTTSMGITNYRYNALQQRVAKSGVGSEFYFYETNGNLMSEASALNGPMNTQYVWLVGEPIALIRNNIVYYIHSDQIQRPEVVTDGQRNIVWRANNTPYNRMVSLDSVGGLNLGLPGQYFDNESGLWYNWHRYYDANLGRYITSDPIGLAGGLNTYAYTSNTPLAASDPLGLARTPDYATLQFSFYVGSISVTFTRYGDLFGGYGFTRSYPGFGKRPGVSFSAGYKLQPCAPTSDEPPSQNDLNSFLSGLSQGAGTYYGFGGDVEANGSGVGVNVGVGIGGAGGNVGSINGNTPYNVFGEGN